MSESKENSEVQYTEEEYSQVFSEIKELGHALKGIFDMAYTSYSSMVDSVLCGRITNEKEIEKIMDGMLDFGDDVRFLELYRKLCRHVYYHYPALVGEHVSLFRAQFMRKGESESYLET